VSHRHDPVTQPDRGRAAQPTPPTFHLQTTVTPYSLVRVCRDFGVSVVCTFTVDVTSDLFLTPMHAVVTRCTAIRAPAAGTRPPTERPESRHGVTGDTKVGCEGSVVSFTAAQTGGGGVILLC
jgi:hypothetical protein